MTNKKKDSNSKLGLPTVSTSEVVNILTKIYVGAIRSGMPLTTIPTPFLWGQPGVGKSAGMYELADNIEKQTGRRTHVIDIRLALFSPVDLRGVPYADKDGLRTVWLKPAIFDMDDTEDVINILFLDELSAAPQSVQVGAYQLTLDRKVGEHHLPENCIVVAAGNRTTDQSVSFKMPKALANRMMHFEICSDFGSWKCWAKENRIDERIIDYLFFVHEDLSVEPETTEVAFPTPRSWTFVSDLLKVTGAEPAELAQAISGAVGYTAAIDFIEFCKEYRDFPSMEGICCGIEKSYPASNDVLYRLTETLIDTVCYDEDLTAGHIRNIFQYVGRFPLDFIRVFVEGLNRNDYVQRRVSRISGYRELLEKTGPKE